MQDFQVSIPFHSDLELDLDAVGLVAACQQVASSDHGEASCSGDLVKVWE